MKNHRNPFTLTLRKMLFRFLKQWTLLALFLFVLSWGTSCRRVADPSPPSVIGIWSGQYSAAINAASNIAYDRLRSDCIQIKQ